ncbi:hypothetical protein LHJ74_09345 [Streptomyces sp. N2-109]|uniref:Secreted protein n=1 Tax=Streptomyces gossypii TaxID=2883101 RepID=A0ABT2JQE6_9ACTN|nr:hypothetical protein [Streptomyces gossypii]MCT2590113.1 hypothetical protein [Streptomyces gossypii]
MPAAPLSSPSSRPSSRLPRGIALYVTVLCVLAVVASVISFVNGSWLGVVWLLLAGLTSNMALYYLRRSRAARVDPR